jgi:hypothetical protein
MVNHYATRAGKQYETDLMKFFREQKFECERLRLTGKEDEGDLVLGGALNRVIIEAKRTKSLDLAGWINEARTERNNYAAHRGIGEYDAAFPGFIVVHKARGKGIGHSYVTTTLEEWLYRA